MMLITLIVLALAALLFVTGWVRADLTAVCAALALVLTGVLTPEEAAGEWVNLTLMRRWAERYLHSLADVDESGPLTPLMVRQLAATPQGLPVEFYFFLTEKTWKPYEMLLAEIMEHIMATLPRFGLRLFQYAAPPHPAPEADAPAAAGS